MLTEQLIDELKHNEIIVIFFFWKKMDIDSARLLGKTTKKQIKALSQARKCRVKIENGNIYLRNRKILVNNILDVYRDYHIHDLIYVLGVDFTCTLYIFNSKKR